MHIHSANAHPINLYTAAEIATTAATKRAAEVRKRLLKSAQTTNVDATPEESALVGQWLDPSHSKVLPQDEYHTAASGKDSDFA